MDDVTRKEVQQMIDASLASVPFTGINLDADAQRVLKLYNIKILTHSLPGTLAQTAGNYKQFFTADRGYEIIGYSMVHHVAATVGTVTLQLEKCPSGTAPGSGSTCLATALSLKATVDTPQFGVLSATKSSLLLIKGDSLAHLVSGTLTTLEGVAVTVILLER